MIAAAAVAFVALAGVGAENAGWAFGARTGRHLTFLEGDGSPSDLRGWALAVDAGYWFTPKLGAALVFEGTLINTRSDRLPPGSDATSYGVFVEGRADMNPGGLFSFQIELGAGLGALALPVDGGGVDRFMRIEPLRFHLGPSMRVSQSVDLALLFGAGLGWFHGKTGGVSCAITGTCEDSKIASDTELHAYFVTDLAVAARFEL